MISRNILVQFVSHLQEAFPGNGELYLVGQTSLLMEDWIKWIEEIEFTAEVAPEDRTDLDEIVEQFRAENRITIIEESPADVIPLPEGYSSRHRKVEVEDVPTNSPLTIYHFDPYSVAFRYIARGDEQDYHLVLNFLEHGWINEAEMNRLLEELLPRFSFQTIQQDPAEFRRRYKGLLQMWRAQRGKREDTTTTDLI